MDGGKHHAAVGPACVLHEFLERRVAPLRDERDGRLPEAALLGEVELADFRQPLQRVVAAGPGGVRVGPLVVAGRVDERAGEGVELIASLEQQRVGGVFASGHGVADMDREHGSVAIDLLDEAGKRLAAVVVARVRHTADDGEGEALRPGGGRSRRKNGWNEGQGRKCGKDGAGQAHGAGSMDGPRVEWKPELICDRSTGRPVRQRVGRGRWRARRATLRADGGVARQARNLHSPNRAAARPRTHPSSNPTGQWSLPMTSGEIHARFSAG